MSKNKKNQVKDAFRKASEYSYIFYIIVLASLLMIQFDLFKDTLPKDYIVNFIVVIASFALGVNFLDRIMHRKDPKSKKPYLVCPECEGTMKTSGKWVCENCHKEFGEPKKE